MTRPYDAFGWVALIIVAIAMFHAIRFAARFPKDRARPHYSRWYGLVACWLGWVFIIGSSRAFFLEPFKIPSSAMLPTLKVGSAIIVKKWGYGHYSVWGNTFMQRPVSGPMDRGDLIVFDYPDNRSLTYIKRLIGLPGDKIIYRNKTLSINGQIITSTAEADYLDENSLRYLKRFSEGLVDNRHGILIDVDAPTVILSRVRNFQFKEQCNYDSAGFSCEVPAGHYFMMGDNRDNSEDSRYWGFVPASHVIGKVVYFSPQS